MDIQELIESEVVDNVLYLPDRYNEAIIGVDAIYGDRIGYDINMLNDISDEWRNEYDELVETDDMPLPYLVDTKADPTGLKSYANMDDKIIGVVDNSRLVYMFDGIVEHFMEQDEMEYDEAVEWVEYNTLRATPYEGAMAPVVLNDYSND